MRKYISLLPVQDFVLAVGLFAALGVMAFAVKARPPEKSSVLADLGVSASVPICELHMTTYPEGRIPATGNWATILQLRLVNSSDTTVLDITSPTNNLGQLNYDLCANSVDVGVGPFDFYLQGYSHLRKRFENVANVSSYVSTVLFTQPSQYLLAGETSIVFDNFINGLDLSTQVVSLFTGDVKNDLNQDGQVNSLDLSMTINNLYRQGD